MKHEIKPVDGFDERAAKEHLQFFHDMRGRKRCEPEREAPSDEQRKFQFVQESHHERVFVIGTCAVRKPVLLSRAELRARRRA